jgi:hypothetical protein
LLPQAGSSALQPVLFVKHRVCSAALYVLLYFLAVTTGWQPHGLSQQLLIFEYYATAVVFNGLRLV